MEKKALKDFCMKGFIFGFVPFGESKIYLSEKVQEMFFSVYEKICFEGV